MRCRSDRSASLHRFRQSAEPLRLFCAYSKQAWRFGAQGSSWRPYPALGSFHCVSKLFSEILLGFASRFHTFQVAVRAPGERRLV